MRSVELSGSAEWQRVSFRVQAPEQAEKALIACRSDGNDGAVWFDDLGLILLPG